MENVWVKLKCPLLCVYSKSSFLRANRTDLVRRSVYYVSSSANTNARNKSTDSKPDPQLLSYVWARFRTYRNERLPADQREFWISRDGFLQKEEVKKLHVSKESNFVFLKPVTLTRWLEVILRRIGMFIFERLFIIKFPSRNDVVNASHQAFTIIAEAIRNDDLDVLRRRGLCTVYSRLRYQKNELDKLTSKQKKVFNITKEDLIGHQGILRVFYDHPFHNIRLTALPNDENDENSARTTYLLYGVMLIALYKKNLLFKTVSNHPLPSTYKWGTDERMVLKMPAGYDFLQRKHLVMYLEFAQPLNLETRTLVDDVTLYDFHIGCF